MSHTLVDKNRKILSTEALPVLGAGYRAVFRAHFYGRGATDDEVYLGGEYSDPVQAVEDAVRLMLAYQGGNQHGWG